MQESTAKVIEQLTMLNMQREGEFETATESLKAKLEEHDEEEIGKMNRSFSFAFKGGKSKSKKLKKRIEELEDEISELKSELQRKEEDSKSAKKREKRLEVSEQELVRKVYILEEFMLRSHQVMSRKARVHMRSLKKALALDMKIFNSMLQKQDYNLKLEESKKAMVSSIKELEESIWFSKNFSSGMSNNEIE